MNDKCLDAEPLDGKRVKMYRDFFVTDDVAAAVQHLKKQIKQDMGFSTMLGENEQQVLLDLVDEAFADVVDVEVESGDTK